MIKQVMERWGLGYDKAHLVMQRGKKLIIKKVSIGRENRLWRQIVHIHESEVPKILDLLEEEAYIAKTRDHLKRATRGTELIVGEFHRSRPYCESKSLKGQKITLVRRADKERTKAIQKWFIKEQEHPVVLYCSYNMIEMVKEQKKYGNIETRVRHLIISSLCKYSQTQEEVYAKVERSSGTKSKNLLYIFNQLWIELESEGCIQENEEGQWEYCPNSLDTDDELKYNIYRKRQKPINHLSSGRGQSPSLSLPFSQGAGQ